MFHTYTVAMSMTYYIKGEFTRVFVVWFVPSLYRPAPEVHFWSRQLQALWSLNSGTDSDDTDDGYETQFENRYPKI